MVNATANRRAKGRLREGLRPDAGGGSIVAESRGGELG